MHKFAFSFNPEANRASEIVNVKQEQMKKFLLAIMAAASFAWAGANDFISIKADDAIATETAESRAESLNLRFCGNLASWSTVGAVDEMKCYIYVPADVATKYAGNEITSIVFNAYVTSTISLNGSVFVTEDINGTPQAEKTMMVMKGTNNNTGKFVNNPYVIKEGVGFYIGYKVLKPAYNPSTYVADYPICFDQGPANQYAGYVDYTVGSTKKTLSLATNDANLFIYATTSGDVTEADNVFATGGVTIGNFFTLPVCGSGDQEVLLPMYNCGTNDITSIDYEYSIDGGDAVAMSEKVEFPALTTAFLGLPVNLPASRSNLKVDVKKINGIDFEASSSVEYIAVEEGFDHERKFVVEEFTGTWCGWCPRGIVGFENMDKTYPDKFIGIAVHYSDAMSTSTYNAFTNKYYQGAPSSIVNRDPMYQPDPNFDDLSATLQVFDDSKAAVQPYITSFAFDEEGDSATVETKVVFGFNDSNAKYRLAFVVLEDSVLGRQTNYYSGGSNGTLDGWEKMGSPVTWNYSHVARNIYEAFGINNSLPLSVKAGTGYDYKYRLSMKSVKKEKRKDAHVVLLVLDSATGCILNACKVGADEGFVSGIANVAAEKSTAKAYGLRGAIAIEGDYADAKVYTIGGQLVGRTEGLAAGIYVVRVDGATYKVIVK